MYCTRAVNTAVYRVHDRVQGTRPCTRPCSGHGRTMHGRVHGTYTVRYGPRTGLCFAAYRLRTRPCSGHGRTMCMARVRPCTQFVHGRGRPCTVCTRPPTAMHEPCTWSVRDRVHGRVYGRVGGRVYGPCARRCTYRLYGRVHGRSRRVRTVYIGVQGPYTWCVHDRIQGTPTRSCTIYTAVFTALYTAAHGRVQTVYTAVHGPWFVRDPITARTVNAAVFTARVHGIVRTVYTGVQGPCTWCVHGHVHGRVQGTPTRSCTLYPGVFTARVHGP